jgi:glycosyltransferase involved in cell wall biosynthesis
MQENPLVSIIVPAFNAEQWIRSTLTSALSQTYSRIEVIVVDDGSTDDTVAIAESIGDERVCIVVQENAGACEARNRGLEEAQGDYVQFLDADDLLSPDKIERQIVRLKHETEGTVSTCSWARFWDDDVSTAQFETHYDWKDYPEPLEWLIQCGRGYGTMPTVVWLAPRSILDEVGPWTKSLRVNQDGEYFARVVLAAPQIAFVSDARAYYRSGRKNSISQVRNRAVLESRIDAMELIASHMLRFRDTPEVREAVAGLFMFAAMRAFPNYPDITKRAEERVEYFGGSARLPNGGRGFRAIRDVLGWKTAMKLQAYWRRLRYR